MIRKRQQGHQLTEQIEEIGTIKIKKRKAPEVQAYFCETIVLPFNDCITIMKST